MKLVAKEGFKYTQQKEVEIQNRIICREVYLAVNDKEDNWKLITDAEANDIENAKKEYYETLRLKKIKENEERNKTNN